MESYLAAEEAATCTPPLDVPMQYTVFRNKFAREAQRVSSSWPHIVDAAASADDEGKRYAGKQQCPLIKLATIGDARTEKGSLRSDANMLQVFGVEGDYDAGHVSPLDAADMLERRGIEALVYTTASHSAEKPKWRVLAPLSVPCAPAQRRHAVAMLNAALGGILAHESFTTSQAFYFGAVEGALYEAFHTSGACIDTLNIEAVYPVTVTPQKDSVPLDADRAIALERVDEKTFADLQSALKFIDADAYPTWTAVGQHLKCLGDAGRELWLQWSATSEKFDDGDAASKWETFTGDRSDYRAVFTKAAAAGWVNPISAGPAARPEKFVDLEAQERDEARRELEGLDLVGEPTPERVVELAAKAMLDAAPWLQRYGLKRPASRWDDTPLGEILSEPPMQWLIEGVLPQSEFGMIFGEPRVGKSFAITDMALAIARGTPWRGIPVRQSRVVYVAAEGSAGLSQRLQAYQHEHQVQVRKLPFSIKRRKAVPNLASTKEAEAFAKRIVEVHGGAGLIVVDTLAQTTGGKNENTGEDMQPVIDNCKLMSAITGALVLVVHHSGKDSTKGARGWSGLYGACDVQLKVERDASGEGALHVAKLKDEEDGASYGFKLHKVIYGVREDGKELTSCVVAHTAEAPRAVRGLGGVQRVAFEVARDMLGDGLRFSREQLEDGVVARLEPTRGERDRRPEYAKRAVRDLLRRNILRIDVDEKIAMPQSANVPQTLV